MAEAMMMRCNYAWGELVTLRVGNEFSIPLHPEHMERIAAAKAANEPCFFRDETGAQWLVEFEGDNICFSAWRTRDMVCTVRAKDLFPA